MTTTAATATATTSGAEATAAAASAAATAAAPPADDAQMTAASLSSDDDDSDIDSESNNSNSSSTLPWLLGFVEPPTSPLSLLRHHFRSKVGGRPAWLDPRALPTPAQLCCGVTGAPLDFLCQVYAPLDESESDEEEDDNDDEALRRQSRSRNKHEDAFHRAVFVFVGPSGSALGQSNNQAIGSRSIRAFRCQLPRENAHYSLHPPPREGCPPPRLVDVSTVTNADRWRVAECEASIVAAAAEAAAAAGGSGQIAAAEAEAAAHAAAAALANGGGGGASPPLPRLFPEAELVVEEEGSDCGSDVEEAVAAAERAMKTTATTRRTAAATPPPTPAQKGEQEGGEAATEAEEDAEEREEEEEADAEMMDSIEAAVHPDAAAMARFAARVARAPSQVLRYRFDRRMQKPKTKKEKDDTIWPRASPKPPSAVPPCSNCGSPRALEFQLLPQMLNFLGCDAADEEAPDWSCVGVWSCVESCSKKRVEDDASGFSSPSASSSVLLPVSKTGGAGISGGPSAYLEEFVWVQPSDAQQQGAS